MTNRAPLGSYSRPMPRALWFGDHRSCGLLSETVWGPGNSLFEAEVGLAAVDVRIGVLRRELDRSRKVVDRVLVQLQLRVHDPQRLMPAPGGCTLTLV